MVKISKRHIIAWYRFDDELAAFAEETEGSTSVEATLYEDAFTERHVADFHMSEKGVLTWYEDGKRNEEQMLDEDDAREWLKFWRACLRRAKRYWSMDAETIDAIHDGKQEDLED